MAGYIDDIDTTSPLVTDDPGDFPAEMRNFKARVKDSFPNISDPVTATEGQLNYLSGVTAGTAQASKALVLNAGSDITAGIDNISLGGLTATGTVNAGTLTDGTASISSGSASSLALGATCTGSTATSGDSTTKLATTAFVADAISSVGSVAQIAFASHHSNIVLTTSYQDVETVTLSDVQSGNSVLLLALTQVRGASEGGEYYMDLTDNSDVSVMTASEAWRHQVITAKYASVPCMVSVASPGTGTVIFKLRGKEETGAPALEVEGASLVAIEYTP